ncbi:NADH-quinone oxidoreductase subunit NuoK [Chloracidobacterium thermophilum]|uniref:NADH-quinone oxidoreductase subunit NuoK n=1 Tax=Chloracidobacterium thermophilum TaxID=458033 RepID=UPI000ADAE704
MMTFLALAASWAARQVAEPSFMERYVQGLKEVDTSKFLVLSAIIFSIGIGGVLIRRNIIVIFMSVELMLSAANLNFIAFARYWQTQGSLYAYNGHVMTIFVIVVAAAEAALGLGLLLALYRNRETVAADEINLLKW